MFVSFVLIGALGASISLDERNTTLINPIDRYPSGQNSFVIVNPFISFVPFVTKARILSENLELLWERNRLQLHLVQHSYEDGRHWRFHPLMRHV